MKRYVPFGIFWFLNFTIIYLASLLFPENIVIGNFQLTPVTATIWSSLLLTFSVWISKPVLKWFFKGMKLEGASKMFVYYWAANSIVLWILSRFPTITGFGISQYYWAIGLALAINAVQATGWGQMKAKKMV